MRIPNVGDWVCFKQLGMLTYAKLEFIQSSKSTLYPRFVTTAGECWLEDILEVRCKEE